MRRILVALVVGIAVGRFMMPAEPQAPPRWSTLTPLVEPRQYAQSAVVATGEIFIDGGMGADLDHIAPSRAMLIDPRTGAVRYAEPNVGHLWQTVVPLPSGLVLVAGGVEWHHGWEATDRVDLFDPWTGRWIPAAPLHEARSSHSAALLPDGRVFVAGGNQGPRLLHSVEIYDAQRDEWTLVKAMPTSRTQFSMSVLPGGRVIVIGGREQPGLPSKTTLIWDPRTDRWTAGPDMRTVRLLDSAVTLPNGDVLVIGGDRSASNSAERYDARENVFVYAGMLARPRIFPSAAVLSDGRVVIAGGLDIPSLGRFAPSAHVEVWSPESNRWDELPALEQARVLGALVATDDGVFFIGGANADEQPLDLIEVFR